MASARENDLNPNTYIGLSLEYFTSFLTHVGERVAQPEFGSKLKELVFEQINDELPVKIEEEVKRAVSTWLPYININEVNTLTNEGDQNRIFVEVKFTTTLNASTQQQITLDAGYTADRV